MSEQLLHTCDLCPKAVFHTREALIAHVDEKHASLVPDHKDLEAMTQMIRPQHANLIKANQARWQSIGAKSFDVASHRDAGPARLKQACDARAQLELIAKKWNPNAEVYVFGSSVAMGLWDGLSDIDCTVVDVAALDAGDWPPNEKTAVRGLVALFREIGFTFQNLEAIEHARVPIIKHNASVPAIKILGEKYELLLSRTIRCLFDAPQTVDERTLLEAKLTESASPPEAIWWDAGYRSVGITLPDTNSAVCLLIDLASTYRTATVAPIHEEYRPDLFHVDFDLSFRTFGIRNSHLLRAFLTAHPCGRPGALILKDWSKSSGVNNSFNGFLTSYAVNIMWIYFLVQKGYAPYVDPKDIPASLRTSGHLKDPQYSPLIPPEAEESDEARKTLHSTMGRMLYEFFAFFCFEFDWANNVVSLNRAGITTKVELGWTDDDEVRLAKKSTRYLMCIEDPYEENLNLGRHLGECRTRKVIAELRRGLISLVKDDVSESTVFPNVKKSSSREDPPLEDVTRLIATSAMMQFDGSTTSAAFKQHLETCAGASLAVALQHWEWNELVRRLGYKQVAGHLFPVRSVSHRRPPQPLVCPEPPPPGNDVTQQLIDEFLQERAKQPPAASPDWVVWHPPGISVPHTGPRIIKTSWCAPKLTGNAAIRNAMRVLI